MQAIRIHKHGGIEVLNYESLPTPKAKENEVIIQIRAAAMNHLDIWVRRGVPGVPLPMILGSDGAGIITEIGDKVTKFNINDEVCIQPLTYCDKCDYCINGMQNYCHKIGILGETQDGTFCEYMAISESNVYPKPSHLSFEETAAFPLTAQTAYSMLVRRAKIQVGETVFVWGAGSGVGTMAIQIAKAKGCNVIATAGSEKKINHAKDLGADFVLDHYNQNIVNQVKEYTDGFGVDVIIEHVGEATWEKSMKILGKGGRLVTCGATTGPKVNIDIRHLFSKQQSIMGSTMGDSAAFDECLSLILDKKIKPIIDRSFSFEKIRDAHDYLENSSHVGKVILLPK